MKNTANQTVIQEGFIINRLLRYIAIAGNIIFVLWILVNAIDEGFSGVGRVEIVSYIGLLFLLTLNVFLLCRQQSNVS
ncbi:MAG: hypothetical protein ACR2GD_00545 [Pyrinomonadaceae bacterium]